MIETRVQTADFDMGAELARFDTSGVGAVASFAGLVRGDGGVRALELEHYPGMTEAALAKLAQEAQARWRLAGALIVHRVGRLELGERIVLAATASAHRAAAFEACAYLMDRLKTDAPFWKKEYRDDGGAGRWVAQRESDTTAAAAWDGRTDKPVAKQN